MHPGSMKPLLFLFIACLVPALWPSSSGLFLHPKPGRVPEAPQPFSFNAPHFPAAFSKTTAMLTQPLTSLQGDNRIFEKVETEASVDTAVWRSYLQKRLQPFFDTASENISAGSYRVDVRFVVEVDGRISGATAITDPGYGLAKVSADAVRHGPRWKPGEINTCFVPSYHVQPITFRVVPSEEGDAGTTVKAGTPPAHPTTTQKCETDTAAALWFLP